MSCEICLIYDSPNYRKINLFTDGSEFSVGGTHLYWRYFCPQRTSSDLLQNLFQFLENIRMPNPILNRCCCWKKVCLPLMNFKKKVTSSRFIAQRAKISQRAQILSTKNYLWDLKNRDWVPVNHFYSENKYHFSPKTKCLTLFFNHYYHCWMY